MRDDLAGQQLRNTERSVFLCNHVLSYPHSNLEERRTGLIVGPMTFGEVASQWLNQTLVYPSIEESNADDA